MISTISISPRLLRLAEYCQVNRPFWDIGCDHGLVGMYALKNFNPSEVHFVDSVASIVNKVKDKVERVDSLKTIPTFYHSNKAEDLEIEVFGTVVVAGVGGRAILSILQELFKKNLLKANQLILSPHTDVDKVINLFNEGELSAFYSLKKIESVLEKNRERKILLVERI